MRTYAEFFCNLVNNPQVHCEFHRGEWHVPDYQGVRVQRGMEERGGYSLDRTANISSQPQLMDLMSAGRQSIQGTLQNFHNAGNALPNIHMGEAAPQISASTADQPPLPHGPDMGAQQFQAEVNLGCSIGKCFATCEFLQPC